MVVRAAEPAFLVVILFLEFCIYVDIKQNSEEAGVGLDWGEEKKTNLARHETMPELKKLLTLNLSSRRLYELKGKLVDTLYVC